MPGEGDSKKPGAAPGASAQDRSAPKARDLSDFAVAPTKPAADLAEIARQVRHAVEESPPGPARDAKAAAERASGRPSGSRESRPLPLVASAPTIEEPRPGRESTRMPAVGAARESTRMPALAAAPTVQESRQELLEAQKGLAPVAESSGGRSPETGEGGAPGAEGAARGAPTAARQPTGGDTTISMEGEPPSQPRSGQVISPLEGPPEIIADRYRIVSFVGGGGFGAVYKAVDERLEKVVAVKLLTGHRSRSDAAVRRFRAEALAASRLSHPCIVSVTDYDVLPDGRPYLVMEFVSAPTLELLLTQAPRLQFDHAIKIARQVCAALDVAHREHVIHRDLKPANITVAEGDDLPVVKILDFGVAKLVEEPGVEGLTGAGQLIGTPAYMAPELIQERFGQVDGRTDIYSLGVVLYEMVTGTTPYAGRGITDMLMAHLTEEPTPPRHHRPDIPADLEAVILKAMAKRPEKRFESAQEMGQALAECLVRYSATATSLVLGARPRRKTFVALGAAALAALGIAGVVAWRTFGPREPVSAPALVARDAGLTGLPASRVENAGGTPRAEGAAAAGLPAAGSGPASRPGTSGVGAEKGGGDPQDGRHAVGTAQQGLGAVAFPGSAPAARGGDRQKKPGKPDTARRRAGAALPDAPTTKFRIPK